MAKYAQAPLSFFILNKAAWTLHSFIHAHGLQVFEHLLQVVYSKRLHQNAQCATSIGFRQVHTAGDVDARGLVRLVQILADVMTAIPPKPNVDQGNVGARDTRTAITLSLLGQGPIGTIPDSMTISSRTAATSASSSAIRTV
jgi:hypothetical protein